MARGLAFSLGDTSGARRVFPTGRDAVLVFVKRDCPTCGLSAPLLEALHRSYQADVDVWVIAQDEDGGRAFADEHRLTAPVLDDSALRVSFEAGLDTVPTVVCAGPGGEERSRFVGFGRDDWQRLVRELSEASDGPAPEIAWQDLPESRPGCGSRSVEPGVAERLEAEVTGSPIRSRRIEIGERDDPFEFLFDQGVTDGLPVVPPTPERVVRMLAGTSRDPGDVVAIVPPNLAPATVEKIAVNAVMAGCRPEFLPVVIAAVEAICTDEFNLHGVLATTYFPTPVLVVNGPVRDRIGMNYGMNCLGQGNRANATIGRAVQLVVRNVGGGRPGEVDRSTLGQPGKFTLCFAEHEARSPWEPLHVEKGFRADQSTVTAYAGGAPNGFVDQLSRNARSLATSYGLTLAGTFHPKYGMLGEILVVIPPEHVDTFRRDGWTKDRIREEIQRVTERPVRELLRDEVCAEGLPPELIEKLGPDALLPKFRSKDEIVLVVAGGEAGKFGAVFGGWVSGPMGSSMVTRPIGE